MTISPLLLTQVEALNEDRALKLNRVKAVEGERENLEGAKAEAEDFLTKEFQICQKQKVTHMLARKDAVAAKERHEAQAEQLEGKLRSEVAAMEDEIRALRKEHDAAVQAQQEDKHMMEYVDGKLGIEPGAGASGMSADMIEEVTVAAEDQKEENDLYLMPSA